MMHAVKLWRVSGTSLNFLLMYETRKWRERSLGWSLVQLRQRGLLRKEARAQLQEQNAESCLLLSPEDKVSQSGKIMRKGRAPGNHGNQFFKNTRLGFRTPKEAIAGMAINDDDLCNQSSTKMSSEFGSDDLWSSLSSFMDGEGREPLGVSAASQSLMGLSTSLFNDANSFVMDKEDPAEYVPAPAISAADLELNTQLENVLYVLREVLPGPMVKTRMDNKLLEAWSFVSDDIKVQDPIVCLEGKDRLWSWLRALATTNAHVHLNEIYAERSRAHPFKGFIHAVWTLVFPEELQPSLKHPTSRSSKCVERSSLQLNLSGESKLEVDRTGQVMSIESKWYVAKEGEKELDSIKLLLTSLLLREAHN